MTDRRLYPESMRPMTNTEYIRFLETYVTHIQRCIEKGENEEDAIRHARKTAEKAIERTRTKLPPKKNTTLHLFSLLPTE